MKEDVEVGATGLVVVVEMVSVVVLPMQSKRIRQLILRSTFVI